MKYSIIDIGLFQHGGQFLIIIRGISLLR